MTKPIDPTRGSASITASQAGSSPTPYTDFVRNFAKGGMAGGIASVPLIFMINGKTIRIKEKEFEALQKAAQKAGKVIADKPPVFQKNMRTMFKGLPLLGSTFGPLTAAQNGFTNLFEAALSQNGSRNLTFYERLACAMGAGVATAPFWCAVNTIITQQQRAAQEAAKTGSKKIGYYQMAKQINTTHRMGGFFRAVDASVIKESVTSGIFFGLAPALRIYFQEKGCNDPVSRVAAGGIAGFAAVVLTQPADGKDTLCKWNLNHRMSFKEMYTHPERYAGGGWRWAMFATAGVFIPYSIEKSDKAIDFATKWFQNHF